MPTGLTKAWALQETRGLKAHKFHAVQHANVPSADMRAFNPAALLLSTLLPLSSLFLFLYRVLPFFYNQFDFFFLHQPSFVCHLYRSALLYSIF